MKRMKAVIAGAAALLLVVALLGVADGPQGEGASDLENAEIHAAVLSIAEDWINAWNQNDFESMSRLHDTDLRYYWRGRPRGYDAFMEELREHIFPNETFEVEMVEPHVQVLNQHTGIASFQMRGATDPDGTPPGAAVTLVVVERDEVWTIIHVHESPVR